MRKYIDDLDANEMLELLDHHDDLDKIAFDWALDNVYSWVGEYLHDAPRKDVDYMYFDRGEHFTVKDATYDFMNWIDGVQADYEWLNDDTYEKCKQAHELWKYGEDNYWDIPDEDIERYESLKEEIGDEIFALMKSEYDYAFTDQGKLDAFDVYLDNNYDEYKTKYVDTDTWEIHDTQDENDPEYEIIDDDLSEQMTFL